MTVIGPTLTAAAGVPYEIVGHLASAASLGTLWFLMGGTALVVGDARVAGRDDDIGDARIAREGARDRVFPRTGPDEEDSHVAPP